MQASIRTGPEVLVRGDTQTVETIAAAVPLHAVVNVGEKNHHEAMIRFGLVGTAVGCALGTWLTPHIPRSEAMYTVILPITTTYIGLALGFFFAGVRKAVLREGSKVETFAGEDVVNALFTDFEEARRALSELRRADVLSKQVLVVGEDSDEFRAATSPLHHRKVDRFVMVLGAIGAVIGAYWGVIGCPQLAPSLPSVVMSGVMGSFCGAVLGLLTGAFIGGILNLDNGPSTDATVVEGSIAGGVIAVAVTPQNDLQRQQVVAILRAAARG